MDTTQLLACHWLLLRIAGVAPDDLVYRCRGWLAEGRALDVGRAVRYAVLSQRIRLADADIDLLAELVAADGMDTSALAMIAVDDADPMPLYGFAASKAGILCATGTSAADCAPTDLLTNAKPEDAIEAHLLRAVAADPSIGATWRAWRFPGDGAPWPPPRRIWVIETNADANLSKTAGRTQAALELGGEILPQVEVYPIGAEPPSYQQLARTYGALMWSREPDRGIRVAATVTGRDQPSRPKLSAEESHHVNAYLRSGVEVRMIATRADDVVTPGRHRRCADEPVHRWLLDLVGRDQVLPGDVRHRARPGPTRSHSSPWVSTPDHRWSQPLPRFGVRSRLLGRRPDLANRAVNDPVPRRLGIRSRPIRSGVRPRTASPGYSLWVEVLRPKKEARVASSGLVMSGSVLARVRHGFGVRRTVVTIVAALALSVGAYVVVAANARTVDVVPVPPVLVPVFVEAARSCPTLTAPRLAGQAAAASGLDPSVPLGVAGLTDAVWQTWAPWQGALRSVQFGSQFLDRQGGRQGRQVSARRCQP